MILLDLSLRNMDPSGAADVWFSMPSDYGRGKTR